MNQGWVLLWLAMDPASPAEEELLQGWAASQQIQLSAPAPSRYGVDREDAGATVAHIEDLLERARVARDSLDDSTAAALIAEACSTLAVRPDLPQAPWLLADVASIAAALATGAGDAERATERAQAAVLLEGPRSASSASASPGGFSAGRPEATLHGAPRGIPSANGAPTSAEQDASGAPPRELRGARPGDRVYWNGELLAPPERGEWTVPLEPGLHHARVLRGRHTAWTGWVDVTPDVAAIELFIPAPAPCSTDDLEPMRSPDADTPVLCDRWVAARPAAPLPGEASSHAVELAWCHRSQCGPFGRWPKPAAPPPALAATPEEADGGLPWWGYALLGTAVSATAAILILSVTQRERQEQPVWIYGGVQP